MKEKRKKHFPLYVKILLGLFMGFVWGLLSVHYGFVSFTGLWIKPFGILFINALKLIAVPLVLLTLIDGISNLHEMSRLSRIGGKTVGLYLTTTVISIMIGLSLVNTMNPGSYLPPEKRQELKEKYISGTSSKVEGASKVKDAGPLQLLVDIVPSNVFSSLTNNRNMLQVIFFAVLVGIAMIMLPKERIAPAKAVIGVGGEVMLKVVDMVMRVAPYGVFALLAGLIGDIVGDDMGEVLSLFKALGSYVLSVVLALGVMILVLYPLALRFITGMGYMAFLRAILPAQLLAFSTSSSAATLPVTLKTVKKRLGVSEEVSSFVLPLGATVNMDGTSIHQAISAVFIAQAFGTSLDLGDQLIIVLTATLSSIGAAAVPGAGLIMLVIVLGAIGIDPEGLALIIALDRPLDMCRTAVNVTGDATVATLVAHSEGEKVGTPSEASEEEELKAS